MNEEKARKILGDTIRSDGSLFNGGWYVAWQPGEKEITLDADFTPDDLEAIAWWMRRADPTSEGSKP